MNLPIKKSIKSIKPYVPGKPIDEVKRELGLRRVIKLASNENPYGPSPKVLDAIIKASSQINRYPSADCYYLRKELSKKLGVDADEIIFGNGSDEIIVLAARALISSGDEVIIAKPSFLIYTIASRIEGAVLKEIPLQKNFHYDLQGMLNAVTKKTKIIFLGNPDNPGGQYLTEEMVDRFMKRVPRNVLVFIDEAYYEYVTAKDYVNSLGFIRKYPNVLITRTFSKMFGLAGLRIGYGISNKKLIDNLNRLREPFNINSLAQAGAIASLKDKKYYRSISVDIIKQRDMIYKRLDEMKVSFVSSYTNFILVRINNDASGVVKKLLAQGIIVRDMSFWGLNAYFRVSIGTEKENKLFLKTLKAVL